MSINLQKGQKINLSKESRSGLNKVMVGLGWDEVPQKRGFFAPKPQDIDCDAFAILLGYDGKLLNHTNEIKQCTVFFNNLVWPGGSIRHMGDNLTGAGEGDDEQIFVDLQNVPYDIGTIVFAVNIYDALNRNQHFGMIRNAFIRVVDYERNIELCKFNLNELQQHDCIGGWCADAYRQWLGVHHGRQCRKSRKLSECSGCIC